MPGDDVQQLELLSRALAREAHILRNEPGTLAPHLHNVLYLETRGKGVAAALLEKARQPLDGAGRPWLRLTRASPIGRSRVVRVLSHGDGVLAVAWSVDGVLASAGRDDTVCLWDPETGRRRANLDGHEEWVWGLAFSPDGGTLASASWDGTVRLWDCGSLSCRHALRRPEAQWNTVVFSPNGRILAAGGDEGLIVLWDAVTGTPLDDLTGHAGDVKSLAFSPDGETLASASETLTAEEGADNSLRLWSVGERRERQVRWRNEDFGVHAVTFSPDGRTLAGGGRSVRLWAVAGGEGTAADTHEVSALAWAPDGRTLAYAGEREVGLLTVENDRAAAKLSGHTQVVWTVAFSPTADRIASGSEDGTVIVWDARDSLGAGSVTELA